MKVTISNGNMKMGYIKSVSLPPVVTCADGCTCAKDCYAVKMCKRYPSVKKSYANNLAVYLRDTSDYFEQIRQVAITQRFFRWHVAGDIPTREYFREMVYMAYCLEDTIFLAFTKQYDIVNEYIDKCGELPNNLVVIFSAWKGMPLNNPHNLPVSIVCQSRKRLTDGHLKAFEDVNTFVCGGNCIDCISQGVGCWYLGKGDIVALPKH